MDESRSYRRAAKRLAILTICSCTFASVSELGFSSELDVAVPPVFQSISDLVGDEQSSNTESLQSLLKGGWQGSSNAAKDSRSTPASMPLPINATAKSLAELLRQQSPVALPTIQDAPKVLQVTPQVAADVTVKERVRFDAKESVTIDAAVEKPVGIAPTRPLTTTKLAALPRPVKLLAPIALVKPVPQIVHVAEPTAKMRSSTITKIVTDVAVAEPLKATETPLPEPTSFSVAAKEPTTIESQFARARSAAGAQGFGMLALDSLAPPVAKVATAKPTVSFKVTIHEIRLRELARESLQTAVHRLSRGATHSAKRSTTESLSHIVAMLDARESGNRHTKHLAVALDAIRESREFTRTHIAVDHDTLVRMVAVHKTTVLKHQSLENTSALTAVDEYLRVAQENLVAACESIVEASDALVMMGKIEHKINGSADTHSSLVALTYHRASVSVDSGNAVAHRELGKTLFGQGMVEQAAWSFAQAVELQPTREHYRLRLQVAQRMRDADTIKQCQTAIKDPRLADPLPIHHLDAKSFAATYKPSVTESRIENVSNKTVSARKPNPDPSASEDHPKSPLSQFKSWLPKFRRE